jgi:hypothetical protein
MLLPRKPQSTQNLHWNFLGLCNAWLFSSGEGTVFWHTLIMLTYVFNNVHLILCSFELSTPALPDNRDTESWSENISHKCYILCFPHFPKNYHWQNLVFLKNLFLYALWCFTKYCQCCYHLEGRIWKFHVVLTCCFYQIKKKVISHVCIIGVWNQVNMWTDID